MNESTPENHPTSADPAAIVAAGFPGIAPEAPDGVMIILNMRPERVFGDKDGKEEEVQAKAAAGVTRRYRTGSWYFAGDFLERVAEIAAGECTGLKARPIEVEVTFALEAKSYRHVEVLLDAFERAHRAL